MKLKHSATCDYQHDADMQTCPVHVHVYTAVAYKTVMANISIEANIIFELYAFVKTKHSKE